MEELISEEGFRSSFEFYDAEEQKFKKLAEEAYQCKMKVLAKWKEHKHGSGKE